MEELTNHATSHPNMSSDGICHLLNLPPELRNRIYELVIPCDATLNIQSGNQCQPGITRVNRQLRDETLLMFYGRDIIQFDLKHEYQAARCWIRTATRAGKLNATKQLRFVGYLPVTIVLQLAEDKTTWSIGVIRSSACTDPTDLGLSVNTKGLADDFYAVVSRNGGELNETALLVLVSRWK